MDINEIMKKTMFKRRASTLLILSGLLTLTGCASNKVLDAEILNVNNTSPAGDAESVEVPLDPDLPNVELTAQTLSLLLKQRFSTLKRDWSDASDSAKEAAVLTQDYRVARLAALLALEGKDYQGALEPAQLWADLKPDDESALNSLTFAQLGSGDVDQAIQSFERNQGDQSLDDYIKKVQSILVAQPDADTALGVIEHYINTSNRDAQVLFSGALVAERFEKYDQAQGWLEDVIAKKPELEEAAQVKARILGRQGKIEERAAFVEQYAKSNPALVGMNINYAIDLAQQKRYQESFDHMLLVLKTHPDDKSALKYTAALAQQLEKKDEAKDYYQQALAQDPSDDDARWSLGAIALVDEKYVTAERLFNDISADEYFIRAQIQVANARYHTKGLKRAISTLDALEPTSEAGFVDVSLARHRLLLRDYKFEEAFGYINEVMLYLPGNFDLLYARALVAAELKKVDIAEADFRAILVIDPNNADVLNAFGYTLADQTGRYEEAKEMIAKALTILPDAEHILDSMGWVLFRLEEYDQALKFLEKAYYPDKQVEIGAHLGEVYWVLGDHVKARAIWQESYEKDSVSPVLSETLTKYGVVLTLGEVSVEQ